MMRRLICLLPLLLAACGSESDIPASLAPDTAPIMPLCVSNACGQVIDIATIPDAENTLTTPDGRVFVSGGTGVFEILRSGDAYTAAPINDAACNFTGLAQRGDVLLEMALEKCAQYPGTPTTPNPLSNPAMVPATCVPWSSPTPSKTELLLPSKSQP